VQPVAALSVVWAAPRGLWVVSIRAVAPEADRFSLQRFPRAVQLLL
jgi:hypothetical protein